MTIIPRDVNGKIRPEAVESVLSAMQATINASVEHDARDIGGLAVASAQTLRDAAIPATVGYVRVSGYAAPGDGGACVFRAIGDAAAYPTDVLSADGRFWTPMPDSVAAGIDARAFGVTESAADNKAALQVAMDAAAAMGCPLVISGDFASSGPLITSSGLHMRWVGAGRLRMVGYSGGVGAFLTNVHPTDMARRVQERLRFENPQVDLSAIIYSAGNTANSENALGFARGVTGLTIDGGLIKGARANFSAASGIGGKGIGLDGGVQDVVIRGTRVEGCYIGFWLRGKEGNFADTLISEGVSCVRMFGVHFEDCDVALALMGRDPTEDPDAEQADMSFVGFSITYHNCGFAPNYPAGGAYRWKSGPVVLGEAQNVLIVGLQGYNDPTYIEGKGGWPAADKQVIGGGLSGPIGCVICGWGRNVTIRNIQHGGDVDAVWMIMRGAAIGDDTAETIGGVTTVGRVRMRQCDIVGARVVGEVKHLVEQDAQLPATSSANLVGSLRDVSATTILTSFVGPAMAAYSGFVVEPSDETTWASARGTAKEIAASYDTSIPRPPAMPALVYNASTFAAPAPAVLYIDPAGSDTVSRYDHGSATRPFKTFAAALIHARKAIVFTDRLSRVTFSFAPGEWGGLSIGSNLRQGEEAYPFTIHITSTNPSNRARFGGVTLGSWRANELYCEKIVAGYFAVTQTNTMVVHDVGLRSYPSVTYALRAAAQGKMNVFGAIDVLETVTYSLAFAYAQDGGSISFDPGDNPTVFPGVMIGGAALVTTPLKWRAVGQGKVYAVQSITDQMSFAGSYYCDASSASTLTQTGSLLARNTAPGGAIVVRVGDNETGSEIDASGWCEAWGVATISNIAASSTSSAVAVTLPVVMASTKYHVHVASDNGFVQGFAAPGQTASGFNLRATNLHSSTDQSVTLQWRARGRIAA